MDRNDTPLARAAAEYARCLVTLMHAARGVLNHAEDRAKEPPPAKVLQELRAAVRAADEARMLYSMDIPSFGPSTS